MDEATRAFVYFAILAGKKNIKKKRQNTCISPKNLVSLQNGLIGGHPFSFL
jgi:hypothetical protein